MFRDSLLASLLDGVRASGNRDVCVKIKPTKRGAVPYQIIRFNNIVITCTC